jgi:DNA repair exonuclease SbcCD ATPase subunit
MEGVGVVPVMADGEKQRRWGGACAGQPFVSTFTQRLEQRFAALDERIAAQDERIAAQDERIAEVDAMLTHLNRRFDESERLFNAQQDTVNAQQDSINAIHQRNEDLTIDQGWIHEMSRNCDWAMCPLCDQGRRDLICLRCKYTFCSDCYADHSCPLCHVHGEERLSLR